MNEEKVINSETTTTLSDEQVHYVYNELSEADKASTENLANAEKETENSNYDEVVMMGPMVEVIPGVDATPANIIEDIAEDENDIKQALDAYNLDDQTMVQLLKVIDDYKAGDRSNIYSKLPDTFKSLVDDLVSSELGGASYKQAMDIKNAGAKILVDSFINDAKLNAAVDDFNTEMNSTVSNMNKEYDDMISAAIDDTFNRLEEIKAEDPERAKVIESVKDAFDNAISFNDQLEFAKHTTSYVLRQNLKEYKDYVKRFNTKVNSNTFGVKVPNIEEIIPIIKSALPYKYTGNDIRKFVICICKTVKDPKELAGTAYNYRMISSIYRYKFTAIDEKGEIIFNNISKVIDEIIS